MRITHPTPQPGRQHALGVDFRDGVATVDSLHPERELALRQHGFTIEADLHVEAPFQGELGDPIIDLTSLTIPQLRDIAETEGVDLPAKALKAEIIEILSRQPATPFPGSIDSADGSFTVEGGLPVTDGTFIVEAAPVGEGVVMVGASEVVETD